MSELLGLIDALEAYILESSKIPMTDKVVLNEAQLLQCIDKIRISAKNGDTARLAVDVQLSSEEQAKERIKAAFEGHVKNKFDSEIQAMQKANKIKDGANDYADYVLANLQLTLTKMQKNLIHLEKNIDSGRQILSTQKQQMTKEGA
tara:strand:+ start:5149 stop:5589 length:441 start_codon:yes stop_codon:yes gene_type:complete